MRVDVDTAREVEVVEAFERSAGPFFELAPQLLAGRVGEEELHRGDGLRAVRRRRVKVGTFGDFTGVDVNHLDDSLVDRVVVGDDLSQATGLINVARRWNLDVQELKTFGAIDLFATAVGLQREEAGVTGFFLTQRVQGQPDLVGN